MTEPSPAAPPAPLSVRQVLVVFSGLLLATLLAALDSTIVATALPTIVGELGGLERLGWVVTAYLLAQTIAIPLYGKLGDLYGRKVVLQAGITIFLLGSALCGLAGGMVELALFRFLQGLGGGGLMVTAQAVVGDIVPPRERGRYQGIFGAVFGLSSVAGPLIGGYLTTALSWRWIFYVNVPIGAVALAVIGVTLPRRGRRAERRVDYLGTGLLATGLTALILLADLGGGVYPWASPVIVSLGVVAGVALAAFGWVESRAKEPILPLRLFRDRTFAAASAISLCVGLSLFGCVTYLPLFLQVVNGASPTTSGLQLLPMMGGMLVTSITSGQLISRWGRYKAFPIAGTAVMAFGLYLLSRMDASTSVARASVAMLVLGAGLGLVMQVLVIAVQNAVDYDDLGVATSGATLFRLIGGALGTAAFGALFASGLTRHLALLPAGSLPEGVAAGREHATALGPQALAALEPGVHALYVDAFTASLGSVFEMAAGVALIGFGLTWLIPERPLRETIAAVAADPGAGAQEVFPMPTDASSVDRLERALSLITTRETRRAYVVEVARRAGLELSPLAAWILVRFDDDPECTTDALARRASLPASRIEEGRAELAAEGLLESAGSTAITARGRDALDRLAAARREHLSEIVCEWSPEGRDRLTTALERVAREFDEG